MDALMETIGNYGIHAIINTDLDSQCTSNELVSLLQSFGIQTSMDGVEKCKDSIVVEKTGSTLKYECVFLKDYAL